MAKLVAWNVMTLDGYFQGDQPWDLSFHQSVWGDELEAFSAAQLDTVGTLLYGRKTYEGMFSYWSGQTGPIADRLHALNKAVASRTMDAPAWHNTRLLLGEAAETVKQLKSEQDKDVYVFGSADLLGSLLRHQLVDEYRICLAPMTLGSGTPLFKPDAPALNLSLLSTQPLKTGGVILRYGVNPQ